MRILSIGALVLLCPHALAQQFTYTPGLIPGTARWTEGVEAADVDNDGDLDLIFAEGEGFNSVGTARQNRIYINQFVPSGVLSFTNESIARFGANVSNGKGVATGDVNGDGYVDVMILNAFNTSSNFLYINRGAAQPGFFDQEAALRGLGETMNSAGAQFGDLDDDGDLDLIVCDSGNSFLGGAGDEARLYFNDGNGFFTENAAALNSPVKNSQMDVQLVDLDGDFDLDFFGPCRGSNSGGNHFLMLNDGAGNFTDVSNTLPNSSTSVYEADCGDLDGDMDVDFFFVSLSGFNEGHIRNNYAGSGNLTWTSGPSLSGSGDDNEVVLMDHDMDGDYDAFIGSLGSREYVWRNDGNLTWSNASNATIQGVGDSTLDATAADLDNDGRYDFITAQGESNSAQWVNKVYLNSGPVDTLPPVVVATDFPNTGPQTWPGVLHVKIRDQVIDDGVNYVTASAVATPYLGTGPTTTLSGGAFSPAVVNLGIGEGLVLDNQSGAAATFEATGPYAWSSALVNGQQYEKVFVTPGNYTVVAQPGGAVLTVNVSGTPVTVDTTYMSGQQFRFSVPALPPTGLGAFIVEFFFRDWPGNETVIDNALFTYPTGLVATKYCTPAVINSTTEFGKIDAFGSPDVVDNDMTISASDLPLNQFGYLLTSMTQGNVPNPGGSSGVLCLSGGIGRYTTQIGNTGASGTLTTVLDLTSVPVTPVVAVQPGQTWNYQYWYRDFVLQPTSNFTEAIEIPYQ